MGFEQAHPRPTVRKGEIVFNIRAEKNKFYDIRWCMSSQDDGRDLFENFKDLMEVLHLKKKKLILAYHYPQTKSRIFLSIFRKIGKSFSDSSYDIRKNVKQNLERSLLSGKDIHTKMCVTVKNLLSQKSENRRK